MSRRLLVVLLTSLFLPACGRDVRNKSVEALPGARPAIGTVSGENLIAVRDLEIGEPVQHLNLTVYPVLSKDVRDEDRFITLDEGLQAGTVEVLEVGAAAAYSSSPAIPVPAEPAADRATRQESVSRFGQDHVGLADDVNRLMVVNKSDKPLYLMPGEVIVGGSQDRTIGEETIIAATGKPVPIDVYCVEHGRWGGRGVQQSAALFSAYGSEPQATAQLAEQASSGKFVMQAGHLNKSARLAASAGEGQQKVWDEVAKANADSGIEPESGAFTANFTDRKVLNQVQPYEQALSSLGSRERIVGVIIAINGKPESTDVFESTPLFRKFWPKLLKGYSLDAFHAAESENSQMTCTPLEALSFLNSVLEGEAQNTQPTDGGLIVSRRENDRSVSFSGSADPVNVGVGGMGGGGFGTIHAAGFSKQ